MKPYHSFNDIIISGDGTWKTCGYAVISSLETKKGVTCLQKVENSYVECLPRMMETVGMVRIFQRSLLRYTSYIGDGDSKTFSSITASIRMEKISQFQKIECVGHVQKNGNSFTKLSDGKSIGEREG
ncbi:hypothetical protein TNCV_3174871 [Trichonephila clavipes]|nr:hypothetical protein TNCV_3174871 [Trichonephila clavipes]